MEAKPSLPHEAPRNGKRYMTAKGVAEMLAMSPKTVFAYAKEGYLPSHKVRSSVRFCEQEVLDWIEAHKRESQRSKGRGYYICKACGSTNVAHVPAGAAKGNGPRPTNGNGAKRRPN